MGQWMWENHVQWVANKAKELAEKYEADVEKVYCAALLHDLGDCRFDRTDEQFDAWSEQTAAEILQAASFNAEESAEIIEIVMRPHSCRPGNLPTTLEGKVLATADALFHLQTSFFPLFCFNNRPAKHATYAAWQGWVTEKLERDYQVKLFFPDERQLVEQEYLALQTVFGNATLDRE